MEKHVPIHFTDSREWYILCWLKSNSKGRCHLRMALGISKGLHSVCLLEAGSNMKWTDFCSYWYVTMLTLATWSSPPVTNRWEELAMPQPTWWHTLTPSESPTTTCGAVTLLLGTGAGREKVHWWPGADVSQSPGPHPVTLTEGKDLYSDTSFLPGNFPKFSGTKAKWIFPAASWIPVSLTALSTCAIYTDIHLPGAKNAQSQAINLKTHKRNIC